MIFGAPVSYWALCLEKRSTTGEHAMNCTVLYDTGVYARVPAAFLFLLKKKFSVLLAQFLDNSYFYSG